jgi:hypothetical protein
MEDGTNLPSGGSDDARALSVSEGADAIAGLLGDPDQDTAEPDEASTDEPDDEEINGEADDPSEGDGDDESETDAEDDDQSDEPLSDDTRKVRLADGSLTTVGDLKQGYLRQADYTRKTQEVAAERKHVHARAQQYAQHEQNLSQWLQFLNTELQASAPQVPDPEKDPIGHMKARAAREQWQHKTGAYQQQLAYLEHVNQQRAEEAFAEAQKSAREELTKARPELRDKAKWSAFERDIMRGATETYGFSVDDLIGIADHRPLLVLADALAYRKSQKAIPAAKKRIEAKPPVTKPSRRQPLTESKLKQQDRYDRELRSTGSLRAGAMAIKDLI